MRIQRNFYAPAPQHAQRMLFGGKNELKHDRSKNERQDDQRRAHFSTDREAEDVQ